MIAYIDQGLSAKEIARIIHRSYRTIETHIQNAMRKAGVDRREKLTEL